MFKIEYYESASKEWYQYGEEEFRTYADAERAITTLKQKDPVSAKLTLRVNSLHKHSGFCGSLSD